LAVGAVHLMVEMACVDEEHLVTALTLPFALVKEPERARQRYRVEEVGANRHYYIHHVLLNQLTAYLLFRGTRITGRVGHYKACAASLFERTVEKLNPEV